MILREYRSADCKEIIDLFYQTVHNINIQDYTKEQVDAWANKNIDLKIWQQSLAKNYCLVAIENDLIVGFGDIDQTGYLDRLYVHKDFQKQGIATKICDKLEMKFNVSKITTHASITAKSFFLKRGYQVIKEQQVTRNGVVLTNYVMEKVLT